MSARKEWIKLIQRLINYNSTDDSNDDDDGDDDDDDDDDASTRDASFLHPSSIIRISDINPLNNSISSAVELQINRSSKRIENEI